MEAVRLVEGGRGWSGSVGDCEDTAIAIAIAIATDERWLHLAAVVDMFSRQVVGMEHAATRAQQLGNGCTEDGVAPASP